MQVGIETLKQVEETNRNGEYQIMENFCNYFEALHNHFKNGSSSFEKMDAALKDYREDVTARKRNLLAIRSQTFSDFTRASPGLVFGVPLDSLLQREGGQLPRLVEACTEWIESNALEVEGIYRMSGNKVQMEDMKATVDQGEPIDLNATGLQIKDVHMITGLLKAYLRAMPEPLLTFDLYPEFAAIPDVTSHDEQIAKLSALIERLPNENLRLLKKLLSHLTAVASKSSSNKMGARNLGVVLSPTVLYPKEANVATMVDDMERATQTFTILIEESARFIGAAENTVSVPAVVTPAKQTPAATLPAPKQPAAYVNPRLITSNPESASTQPKVPGPSMAKSEALPKQPSYSKEAAKLPLPPVKSPLTATAAVPVKKAVASGVAPIPPQQRTYMQLAKKDSSDADLTALLASITPEKPPTPPPDADIPKEVAELDSIEREFDAIEKVLGPNVALVGSEVTKVEIPKPPTPPPEEDKPVTPPTTPPIPRAAAPAKTNRRNSLELPPPPTKDPVRAALQRPVSGKFSPTLTRHGTGSTRTLTAPAPSLRSTPSKESDKPSSPKPTVIPNSQVQPNSSAAIPPPLTGSVRSKSIGGRPQASESLENLNSPISSPAALAARRGTLSDSSEAEVAEAAGKSSENLSKGVCSLVGNTFKLVNSVSSDAGAVSNDLKAVALSMRDVARIIKQNEPKVDRDEDGPDVTAAYNETQEIFGKVVKAIKMANEHKEDQKSQLAVQIAAKLLLTGVARLMYTLEEHFAGQVLEEIVTATQGVVNVASQLLRTVYSGASENVDSQNRGFLEKCSTLTDIISDKIFSLPTEIRVPAKQAADEIAGIAQEIINHVATYHDIVDDAEMDQLKNSLTANTKSLVKVFRTTTTLYEKTLDSSHSVPDQELYAQSYNLLMEAIPHFAEEYLNPQLLEKLETTANLVKKLSDSADNHTLLSFVRSLHDFDDTLAKLSQKLHDVAAGVIEAEELELHEIQLNDFRASLQRYCAHVELNAGAVVIKLDLQGKFPEKFNAAESVTEAANVLTWTADAFIEYSNNLTALSHFLYSNKEGK
eukprot:TRINITY_DN3389_c0_g1_i4.p1 TRINITY_DN3389_c0_g1~~TRINITY_DN3389_c0_g1_i4.p1  ORF type:complete len:1054 (-),score=303.82 TRINITY_DN3389_c0_g1_i4:634-3795(-)